MTDKTVCVIIPTYGNEGTIADVVRRTNAEPIGEVIVVVDGNPAATLSSLHNSGEKCTIVSYEKNKGKGYALRCGFDKARELGYDYAITLDGDGQHYPEDIPLLLAAHAKEQDALIVGVRNLNAENMPTSNTKANKFSNFWFKLQTGVALSDTQSGYRLYPLRKISNKWIKTFRYESELELLVFASWNGIEIREQAVRVYYPPEGERVSHFRPFADFMRITALNTVLTTIAVFRFLLGKRRKR